MTRDDQRLLLVIAGLALVLRVVGLDWGLPGPDHLSSYHPDEWQTVETALSMLARGSANPEFFNYPTLHPYLLVLPLAFAVQGGLTTAYLAGRLISVLLGAAAVLLAAALGWRLGGRRVGLVAAGLLAVTPLAVVLSHFATVDGPLAAWSAGSLLAATEVVRRRDQRPWRPLLLAAALAGAAAATKYNGALVLGPVVIAAGLAWRRAAAGPVAAAVGLAAALFIVGSPYALLDPAAWPAIRYELFEHPRASAIYVDAGPRWLFHLRWNLPLGFGWGYGLAAAAGLVLLVRERRPEVVPLLVWVVLSAAGMLRTAELFTRYWLPLAVPLAVAAAVALDRLGGRRARFVLLLAAVAAGPALRSRALSAMLARPDARDLALAYCRREYPPGTALGALGSDGRLWFQEVPLQPNNGGARTGAEPAEGGRWRLVMGPEAWAAERPAALAINEVHAREALGARWSDELPPGYRPELAVANRATILPGWVEAGASPAHDWNYILPSIVLFRRAQ